MKNRTGRPCRVRLERVSQLGQPHHDSATGYELMLPLNADGHVDATSWTDNPRACTVQRFRRNRPRIQGLLARTATGRWYFDYGSGKDADHFQGLGGDRFRVGQFVGICEDDGKLWTYEVTSVDELAETRP